MFGQTNASGFRVSPSPTKTAQAPTHSDPPSHAYVEDITGSHTSLLIRDTLWTYYKLYFSFVSNFLRFVHNRSLLLRVFPSFFYSQIVRRRSQNLLYSPALLRWIVQGITKLEWTFLPLFLIHLENSKSNL